MQDIVFVHGMFQNPRSWDKWISLFNKNGYNCIVPAWPMHEGDPSALRANPPSGLGTLHLKDVLDRVEKEISGLDHPVMVGHSVGGLVTQIMLNRGLITAGVAINSVAPNGMIDFDWSSIKNIAMIVNPVKGNDPATMDAKTFHAAFANTLSEPAATAAFEQYATHDSRNVLRDCMGHEGHIDLQAPHGPLLLIGGDKDEIIPSHLTEKNYRAYKNKGSIIDMRIFSGRDHYICGEPGWDEVAKYILLWLDLHLGVNTNNISTGALRTDASHGNLR